MRTNHRTTERNLPITAESAVRIVDDASGSAFGGGYTGNNLEQPRQG
jgi:hypothetical protein